MGPFQEHQLQVVSHSPSCSTAFIIIISLFTSVLSIIIIIIIYSMRVFHIHVSWWSFPQVSRTLLSILAVLNNAVVWIVSTRPPTSKPSSPFNNPLVNVPKAPITIGIIVTFMFHRFFFNSLARSRYLSFFSRSFGFILWSAGTAKPIILQVLFFCWLL